MIVYYAAEKNKNNFKKLNGKVRIKYQYQKNYFSRVKTRFIELKKMPADDVNYIFKKDFGDSHGVNNGTAVYQPYNYCFRMN